MFEGPNIYDNGPGDEPEKVPQNLREVVDRLQAQFDSPENYIISDTEKNELGTANMYALEIMTKTEILDALLGFVESIQLGRETPETLQSHIMFKAIYTKALNLQ